MLTRLWNWGREILLGPRHAHELRVRCDAIETKLDQSQEMHEFRVDFAKMRELHELEISHLHQMRLVVADRVAGVLADFCTHETDQQGGGIDPYFYRALEDTFRGSSDMVKQRLQVYLSDVQSAKACVPEGKIIDIGCGQCEWLELLRDHDFPAIGVDSNAAQLEIGKNKGLELHHMDAYEFLRTQADNSLAVVSGFHIAEHVRFGVLKLWCEEILRALAPGGLIILETSNPENLVVGACNFHTDPTHNKPLPPKLLQFLLQYVGFNGVEIRYLDHEDMYDSAPIDFKDEISKRMLCAMDYSIIGTKG